MEVDPPESTPELPKSQSPVASVILLEEEEHELNRVAEMLVEAVRTIQDIDDRINATLGTKAKAVPEYPFPPPQPSKAKQHGQNRIIPGDPSPVIPKLGRHHGNLTRTAMHRQRMAEDCLAYSRRVVHYREETREI